MNPQAIAQLIQLANLVRRSVEAMEDVASVIQAAQNEGRDLSDDEIATVRRRTDDAIERAESLHDERG